MQTDTVDISSVIPYARNPRRNEAAVAKVAASLQEFGWRQPIVVDEDMVVVAGHTRLEAARTLSMEEVPIHIATGLTPEQIKAYRLADNRVGQEAEWDAELLRLELGELEGMDFALDLTGFDSDELAQFMAEPIEEGQTDPDEVPEAPEEPVTKPGDLWLLGQHRLLCGDSAIQTDLDILLNGQKADMVFTDPPWNVNYGASTNKMPWKARTILNDHKTDDEWLEFCSSVCGGLFSATKPGALVYMVMSAQEWPVIDETLRKSGFHWSSTLIWVKDTLVLSRKDYHTQYEPIWYGWNDNASRLASVEDRKQSDIWQIDRPKRSPLHPTTKPVELIERAVENSSRAGDVVLDLFGGSGSTLIGAQTQGRKAYLMELDPRYCDVIVQRWENFTGKKAERVAPGQG
jgi:DNA modification methylase